MARISAQSAYENRVRVHQLHGEGLSLRAIAAMLSLSLGSVQNYLKTPPPVLPPVEFLNQAVALRDDPAFKRLGPIGYRDIVMHRHGLDVAPVSAARIALHLKKAGKTVAQPAASGDRKRPFYFGLIDKPLELFQCDTVKLPLSDGSWAQFLVVIDWYSRAVWASYLPPGGSEAACLLECFRALGVPRVLSCDNGIGFNLDAPGRLSDFAVAAFKAGVDRLQFIPISRPQYNGRIERSNGTWKHRLGWLHDGRHHNPDPASACVWLYDKLCLYNGVLTHRGLARSRSLGCRPIPALVHGDRYNPSPLLPPADHKPLSYSIGDKVSTPGTVSYYRRLTNGGEAYVGAPDMMFALDRLPGAWYARFDLAFGGRGLVTIYDLEAPYGREIGTFAHSYGADCASPRVMRVTVDPSLGFTPRLADDAAESYFEQAHGKRKMNRPAGYQAGGYRTTADPDHPGEWNTYDRRGRLVNSSLWRNLPDHSEDLGL